MKNYGDWKILQENILSARYKSHMFRKSGMGIIAAAISHV